jgi:hypothetical protein
MVHGGQQPVSGATIQLYTVGTIGTDTASKPMITATVTTDGSGSFDITGDYSCTSDEDQVYLTGTGGNPGLAVGTNNTALALVAALGRCGNLATTSFIDMNEVTTVAAAWSLAAFANSPSVVLAKSSNALGLKNAYLDSHLIADTSTGMAAVLPSNLTIETDKLYALADAIANCINSSGTTDACSRLFTAATPPAGSSATVTAPTDTFTAALNIVKFPGNKVSDVFDLVTSTPPFPTAYTKAPNDWTMSLTITGSVLNYPTSLGIDALGNVWVAGYYGTLSAFTPQGTQFVGVDWGAGSAYAESYGLAIDTSGNVWTTSEDTPSHGSISGSVLKFLGAASGTPGAQVTNTANGSYFFYDSTTFEPLAIAADNNGNLLLANSGNSTAEIYSSNGVAITTNMGQPSGSLQGLNGPAAITFDQNHGGWAANGNDATATHFNSSGTVVADPACCSYAQGIAMDASGYAWVTSFYGGDVVRLASDGTNQTLVDGGTDGGIASGYPLGVSVDAAQNVWVGLYGGAAFTELVGGSGYQAAGTALSPANGYGLDAKLQYPFGILPDQSGNIWVSNYGANTLTMFFGLATPTARPLYSSPIAP